jgi:hypothetical protein
MSALSTIVAACPQDKSIAIHTATVTEALAEALETFRDKQHLDALNDLHQALLDWEELASGYDPIDGTDFSVTVTTEGIEWFVDFTNPQWLLDLRSSIFHGKLLFEAAVDTHDSL